MEFELKIFEFELKIFTWNCNWPNGIDPMFGLDQ